MAIDAEDLEARRKKPAAKDLNPLSIDDLEGYIEELQAEIARARTMITAKKAVRQGAEAFFKR